jgi:predicted nuclease of predicted toxin-antitoxin system
MRFLADENVEPIVVEWLRTLGHDVTEMSTLQPGSDDDVVLALARAEERVLITYDLDFGELVYRGGLLHTGILLLRLRGTTAADRLSALQVHWAVAVTKLPNFVVVHDRKVRVRRPPPLEPEGAG